VEIFSMLLHQKHQLWSLILRGFERIWTNMNIFD
jgi:hypothetical protein